MYRVMQCKSLWIKASVICVNVIKYWSTELKENQTNNKLSRHEALFPSTFIKKKWWLNNTRLPSQKDVLKKKSLHWVRLSPQRIEQRNETQSICTNKKAHEHDPSIHSDEQSDLTLLTCTTFTGVEKRSTHTQTHGFSGMKKSSKYRCVRDGFFLYCDTHQH